MSWRNAALVIAVTLALGACGFRPLYGTSSADPQVSGEMAGIYVQPMPEREGQMVRNALLDRLNPKGSPDRPRYRLEVKLDTSESQVALLKDETATRDEVTYNVSFVLYEGSTGLTSGNFARQFSFDYLTQQYSNISARNDVLARAAQEIATEIRNRMATYFIRATKARAAADVQQEPQPQGSAQ